MRKHLNIDEKFIVTLLSDEGQEREDYATTVYLVSSPLLPTSREIVYYQIKRMSRFEYFPTRNLFRLSEKLDRVQAQNF